MGPDDNERMAAIREHLASRPWTLWVLVAMALAGDVYSLAASPEAISLATVLFTALYLHLLRMLWDGREGAWWFFVIILGAATGMTLSRAFDEPTAAAGLVVCGAALLLLVGEPTRSFVRHQSEARARALS